MRWKLTLEYDGTPFVGWQRQEPGLLSIQQALEDAITAFSGETAAVTTAGRTDAGVHAEGQVVHVDLTRDWSVKTVRDAINAHLRPLPVAVLHAEPVSDEFNARFSAKLRAYRYTILNRRAPPTLEANRIWHVVPKMDIEPMREGAAHLLGHHDFSSFRAADCQAKSPMRTLDKLEITRDGDRIIFIAEARSFLHHQVRNMVGTLSMVGKGRWTPDDVKQALEACDRAAAGPTAPPEGLVLTRVGY
ncbi:tRNA pseudouridine(38-40) synthase TruA [Roseiterribacter gracilis]|uniref:tRNA pseudouridine synthase A n=1 Tax=Roseiterribacter gracilis TaxID=2812848 RepID=A0A8S8X857_9PROT|nr:tRNA pseudouridine synthase A [Rhodospirillales bacterium TMPK1]